MTTPCELLRPVVSKINGKVVREYPETGARFFANVKSYGGTERISNDLLMIEDTIIITAWHRPDVRPNCRVKILNTGAVYEVIAEPENWDMRGQFIVFKCRRVKGDG